MAKLVNGLTNQEQLVASVKTIAILNRSSLFNSMYSELKKNSIYCACLLKVARSITQLPCIIAYL
jgi:hypothetical protein